MDKPKFTDSDAYLFFKAFVKTGDIQIARHFVDSMREWEKTLDSARESEGPERG